MNLLEYSRWGGQEPPSGIENNGKVVQFIDYQTRYLILTDSAETASDLVLQLSISGNRPCNYMVKLKHVAWL